MHLQTYYLTHGFLRSLKTRTHSRAILALNIPFMWCVNSLYWFSGICAFLFYYGCDPIYSGQLLNQNQISTKWFIDAISTYIPSLSGISLSCLFAFSIYQQSISISACSKTLVTDVLSSKLTHKHNERIKKGLYLALIGLSIPFSYLFSYAKNTILSLFFIFNNTFNSPILGLFLLCIFNPYANSFGACVSFSLCILFEVWRQIGIFFFSNLKSPDIKPDLQNCSHPVNYTINTNYYPENEALFYLFSISSIWFCLSSVLFILLFGSLLSVLYSLLRHRKFAFYSESRDGYLCSLSVLKFELTFNRKK